MQDEGRRTDSLCLGGKIDPVSFSLNLWTGTNNVFCLIVSLLVYDTRSYGEKERKTIKGESERNGKESLKLLSCCLTSILFLRLSLLFRSKRISEL